MHVYEGWNESGPQEPHKLAKKIGWENNLSMSEQGTETVDPSPETIEIRARENERNKRFLRNSRQ